MDEATDIKFGSYIHRVYSNKSPLKDFEKRERGRLRGLSKVFKYPLLSQERVKLQTSNLACTFSGSMRTNAHYKFYRKESAQNFKVPPIVLGTDEATDFKFGSYIHRFYSK